jgi:hypothetical protein
MHDQIRPERPKYDGYYALSALDQIVFFSPGATRSASLRACPWLSYFAPLALCFDFCAKPLPKRVATKRTSVYCFQGNLSPPGVSISNREFNSLDDFEQFVRSTITPWSPQQRIVLAASMAKRWLPLYEVFCEENEWGDPASFEDAIQSVWKCVPGHELTSKDRDLHEKQVNKNTPHPDDFCDDCDHVLATAAMIDWAMTCCSKADNTGEAVMAMIDPVTK